VYRLLAEGVGRLRWIGLWNTRAQDMTVQQSLALADVGSANYAEHG
jgi:hypothetical protein